jgi:hypothetical protein
MQGKKEQVYWEKVPEKIRYGIVRKAVSSGNSAIPSLISVPSKSTVCVNAWSSAPSAPPTTPLSHSASAPYPLNCLLFARNVHPGTNKTTLRALFTNVSPPPPLCVAEGGSLPLCFLIHGTPGMRNTVQAQRKTMIVVITVPVVSAVLTTWVAQKEQPPAICGYCPPTRRSLYNVSERMSLCKLGHWTVVLLVPPLLT